LLLQIPHLLRGLVENLADLLNLEVDILFFDTTSAYFEIEEEDEGEGDGNGGLRRRGYSRDHRPDLPQAVIGLAVTSACVSMVMFRLDSPLAAVFELSVCAGLIPAIFLSIIGLTQRLTPETLSERRREQFLRFWLLPIMLVLIGIALTQVHLSLPVGLHPQIENQDARSALWHMRHLDLLGQIVALLAAAFGIIILVKERKHG
jgi:NADH-quinone oxidoreductase subunit J